MGSSSFGSLICLQWDGGCGWRHLKASSLFCLTPQMLGTAGVKSISLPATQTGSLAVWQSQDSQAVSQWLVTSQTNIPRDLVGSCLLGPSFGSHPMLLCIFVVKAATSGSYSKQQGNRFLLSVGKRLSPTGGEEKRGHLANKLAHVIALLWTECLCPPKITCWNPNPSDDGIRSWGLWEVG